MALLPTANVCSWCPIHLISDLLQIGDGPDAFRVQIVSGQLWVDVNIMKNNNPAEPQRWYPWVSFVHLTDRIRSLAYDVLSSSMIAPPFKSSSPVLQPVTAMGVDGILTRDCSTHFFHIISAR